MQVRIHKQWKVNVSYQAKLILTAIIKIKKQQTVSEVEAILTVFLFSQDVLLHVHKYASLPGPLQPIPQHSRCGSKDTALPSLQWYSYQPSGGTQEPL